MKAFWILWLLHLGESLLRALSGALSHSLTCSLKHVKAVVGAPMEVFCQTEVSFDNCEFNFPGFKSIRAYKGRKGVKNKDYEIFGNFSKGECGICFSAKKRELEGQFTVEVTFPDEDAPAEATTNVTMPENCHLGSNRKNNEFNEGDEMMFNCYCSKSNPLPKMSLCIGDNGLCIVSNQTSMNASKTAEISDFDKKVVCVVHHPLLDPQGFTLSNFLTISHKPKFISESINKVGRNISINVTLSAYPKPHTISWTRNDGRYLTLENSGLIPVKDTHCIWEAGVNMSEITEDDLNHGFELKIANSEGLYTTKVIPETKKDHSVRTICNIIALFVIVIAVIAVTAWKCLGEARRVALLGYIRNARDQLWGNSQEVEPRLAICNDDAGADASVQTPMLV